MREGDVTLGALRGVRAGVRVSVTAAIEHPVTLTQVLAADAVPLAELQRRYGALLALVRTLIGVVPNCDPYLEIWPAAFRSYNVMVPNLLNLPLMLWGAGAPKQPVALAMWTSSRAAACMYCSAHTCSFALRRGVPGEKVVDRDACTEADRAAIAAAEGLGRVPATFTDTQRRALLRAMGAGDAEWVLLSIAMMGFLNKMMDMLGVELEAATVGEVGALIEPTGWSTGKHRVVPTIGAAPPAHGDSLALKVGLLRHLPAALAFDRRWTRGVPGREPAVGEYLRAHTGHDFPVLRHLTHARAVRAIATMLRENCSPAESVLGLELKHQAGLVYATVVGDPDLAADIRALARAHDGGGLDAARDFAAAPLDGDDPAAVERAASAHGPALLLAKAASPSPARISPAIVERSRELPRAAVVELASWLSVLQLLHRINVFYAAA